MNNERTPPSELPQEYGLRCKTCNCGHFYTLYTRRVYGNRIRRRKECRNCGKRVTTTEKVVGEP